MPPLMAALLMMEFGCDFRIVQAVDVNMQWRNNYMLHYYPLDATSQDWYSGFIGTQDGTNKMDSFWWPDRSSQLYKPLK
jgi:hypothetical protein